jgi:lysozyme family protein
MGASVDFDTAFTALMGNEGGYSNNPADPGGETMWGITARVARQWGYSGAMKDLPQDTARRIAYDMYWKPAHCPDLPPEVSFDVFDCAYNSGPEQAIKILQRAVGTTDDGVFGPATVMAMGCYTPVAVSKRFNGERLKFYTSLQTFATFGRGWVNRIAGNLMR